MSNQLKSLRLLPDGGGAIIFEGFVPFPKAMVEASVRPLKVRQVEQSLFDASAPAPPVGSADKLQGDLGIGQDDRDPLLTSGMRNCFSSW